MHLSIVTTLYRSAPYLPEFYTRVLEAAGKISADHEIILVNDGSPDDSLEIAKNIQERDSRVRIVNLSRNFGHHKAIMAGLAHSRGELVFLIDCDLEEEPEILLDFHQKLLLEPEYDVIYGSLKQRKGNLFERLSGDIFYRLVNALSGEEMPRNFSMARLMRRQYVDSLLRFQEQELYIGGIFHITGFRQASIPMTKKSRGTSTYTMRRKIALLVNAITSFSSKPLEAIFYTGLLISFFAGACASYLMILRLFFNRPILGWTSLIVSVWLIGGLNILLNGIVAIYLSKVFVETKKRPYFIVSSVIEKSGDPVEKRQVPEN